MNRRVAVIGAVALCPIACTLRDHPPHQPESARVERLLTQMTLEEKISLLHGVPEDPATDQGEAGYLPGVPRLGIPPLRFADGPPGVLTRYPATALTATMGLAATFSLEDARANGAVIGRDARNLGVDVALQPFIDLHRDQTFARAYNTFGEDPLLTGMIGAAMIRGIQGEGVMAQAKHFIGYDGANDVTMNAQALHEIYLAPFDAAVRARVSSIMCSYNVINGAYACGNRALLTGVLRDELKFGGFVTSDWGALHGTSFIEAGDDLEMPGSGTTMDSYFEAQLPRPGSLRKPLRGPEISPIPEEYAPDTPAFVLTVPMDRPIGMLSALERGTVSEQTITRAAGRILMQMQRFGLLDRKGAAPVRGVQVGRAELANAETVLKTSEDAAVLLKNSVNALPLIAADLHSLALIGPGALQDIAAGEAGEKALGRVERQTSPAEAIARLAGARPDAGARIERAVADDMNGRTVPVSFERLDTQGQVIGQDPSLEFTRARGNALAPGSSFSWSGTLPIPVNGRYRLYLQVLGASATMEVDGRRVAHSGALDLHGNLVQPGQDNVLPSLDGLDDVRREMTLTAGAHPVTVHVTGERAGQPVQVRLAWVTPEQRNADYQQAIEAAAHTSKAIVFAWSRGRPAFGLPGDQDQLIADVAAVNPNTIVVLNLSEPVAMPWLNKVKAVLLMWWPGDEGGPATANLLLGRTSPGGRLPFTWPQRLDQNVANDPAHPERSSFGVNGRTQYSEGIFIGYRWFDQQGLEPLFPFGFGLSYSRFEYSDLWAHAAADGGLDISVQLRNTGAYASDEVVQVYLGAPERAVSDPGTQFAPRALAAFQRVHLAAGESRRLTLHAQVRALQYWSAARARWVTAVGARTVYVGAASRDLRLHAVTIIPPP
ncbi:MAG TPA: glycoside hydrolase family 3 C-terminal domain-containing protein [Steroidobacteraceae bacterium]|jgi:beta-glucosidase|nr:glycoside hydrolase family 3 C-terminal domain-containing protein [Steroidobacteraceae bacterium]